MHWGAFGCANSAVAPRLADGGVCFPRTAQTNRLSSTRLLCSAVAPRLADSAPGVGVLVGRRPTRTDDSGLKVQSLRDWPTVLRGVGVLVGRRPTRTAVALRLADGAPGVGVLVGRRPTSTETVSGDFDLLKP